MFEDIEINSERWLDNAKLKNEQFRIINKYYNYLVSNYGRIKNIKRDKILKLDKNPDGYYRVDLYCNGVKSHQKVHRLVANAFIKNPLNLDCVNHKDENKENNRIDNLEFCDYRYNINYGSRNKKVSKALSKKIFQLDSSGEIIKVWDSIISIEKELNISRCNIWRCCNGLNKTINGFMFKYAE